MFFFFFKQKTSYEMRISDWSSDVCSSDLACARCYRNRLDLDGAADDRAIRVIEERPAGAEGAAFQPDIVEDVFAACRVIKDRRIDQRVHFDAGIDRLQDRKSVV